MMNAWKAWSPSLYRNYLILVGHYDPRLSQACSRQSCFVSCQSQFCGQIGQVKRNNVGSASASFVFPEPQTCPSDASDASDASVSMCQPWLHIAGGTVVRWYGWFRILASGGNMWERYRAFPVAWLLCLHSLSMSSMNWRLPNHRKLWSENLKQFDHESKSYLRFFLVVIKMVYLYMCVTEPYLLVKQKLYIRSVSTVEGIFWSKETHRRDRLHQCSGLVNIEELRIVALPSICSDQEQFWNCFASCWSCCSCMLFKTLAAQWLSVQWIRIQLQSVQDNFSVHTNPTSTTREFEPSNTSACDRCASCEGCGGHFYLLSCGKNWIQTAYIFS